MTVLERVARAIHEEDRKAGEYVFDSLSPVQQARYFHIATSGLRAARNPSEDIIEPTMDWFADPCGTIHVLNGFNAIIDGIINEADT